MNGILTMGSNRITGVSDPTWTQDVATKNYVDLLGSPRYVIASRKIPTSTNSDIIKICGPKLSLILVQIVVV